MWSLIPSYRFLPPFLGFALYQFLQADGLSNCQWSVRMDKHSCYNTITTNAAIPWISGNTSGGQYYSSSLLTTLASNTKARNTRCISLTPLRSTMNSLLILLAHCTVVLPSNGITQAYSRFVYAQLHLRHAAPPTCYTLTCYTSFSILYLHAHNIFHSQRQLSNTVWPNNSCLPRILRQRCPLQKSQVFNKS